MKTKKYKIELVIEIPNSARIDRLPEKVHLKPLYEYSRFAFSMEQSNPLDDLYHSTNTFVLQDYQIIPKYKKELKA